VTFPRIAALLVALTLCAAPQARAQSPLPLDAFARGVQGRTPGVRPGAPRLVVAFLFDQWRGDLLERYRPAFGKDGFVRILDGGARFTDCTIPYAITFTGPGHATWLSGAPPSVHGVIGNAWYDRVLGKEVACAEDKSFANVGVSAGAEGETASPRFMRAQTVADVLKVTTLGRGKVFAISDKARGAVLPAGRNPDGVYWMDGSSGLYQTSTYYESAPPAWLVAENERRAQKLRAARGTSWVPRASLSQGVWAGAVADPEDTFPHPLVLPRKAPGGDGEAIKSSAPSVTLIQHPLALEGLFDFARAALEGEDLGTDDVPDLLIVSISATDRVGHVFGSESPEALDLASRADSAMADFMKLLDAKVGRGRWAMTITADHGVTPGKSTARRFEAAPFDSVGDLSAKKVKAWVDGVLGAPAKGVEGVALSVTEGEVVFDPAKLKAVGLERGAAARIVADSAFASPWFAAGYTAEDARHAGIGDPVLERVARGWFPGRSGDVLLIPGTNVFFEDTARNRAGHGGPAREQRLVPFVLYGEGIRPGVYREPISTLDIAATTARLMGIEPPAQCEGRSRDEALTIDAR
jgi:hypothetical protein